MAAVLPWKYPEITPYKEDLIKVSDTPPHEVYYAEYGNPNGEPVIYLHGGPGSGTKPSQARYFDPKHYRIILFDQRGCGKSRPHAKDDLKGALADNDTPHLIEDMNKLRDHLGIKGKMHLFGGSWGSTLALAYAIAHPENVKSMTLRGIFLCRKQDDDFFYQGDAADPGNPSLMGTGRFFPEEWKRFVEMVPKSERGDMIKAYHKLLNSPDKATRQEAAKRWSQWEAATMHLVKNQAKIDDFGDPDHAVAFANIENHYFLNGSFLGGAGDANRDQSYILKHIDRIKNIPTEIVQGRYDMVCPRNQADDLVSAWNEVQPDEAKRPKLHTTDAGHSWSEPVNVIKLTEITDRFKTLRQDIQRT